MDWEYLLGGMRRDNRTGLHFTGGGYYHAALGRLVPSGPVFVLPESRLNAQAQDFPFGNWRPPQSPGAATAEAITRWLSEQGPWIKYGIGAALMAATVIGLGVAIVLNPYNPYVYFMALGAVAGGIQGGIEASLSGGDFSDVMLTTGLGAAFGAIAPWGGIGSLVGSAIAARTAIALGQDTDTIASAWQWGGLLGGVAGDFTGGAMAAGKFALRRSLTAGLVHAGPDLLGAGAGAIIGYSLDGTSTGALHGATLGMMAGSVGGAFARGRRGVTRAKSSGQGSQLHRKKVLRGVSRRQAEAYDASGATPFQLAADIEGVTATSSEIARRIRSGEIGVNVLSDDVFAMAYELRFNSLEDLDETIAFAYGRSIYLRRSSPSILSDTVHEGTHAIDFLDGFVGTNHQWERRAYFAEREFLGRLGLPQPHRNSRQLMLHIWYNYDP